MNLSETKIEFITIKNQESIALKNVPVLPYEQFYGAIASLLRLPENHCVNYYAYPAGNQLKFVACVANDKDGTIAVASHEMAAAQKKELSGPSREVLSMDILE